jgi:chemotaxis protein methyltransferase WspC
MADRGGCGTRGTHDFDRLVKAATGLDPAALGPAAVDRAIRGRVRACGLDDRAAYWRCVTSRPDELRALIDAVVISETWFFRDREAFAALARFAAARLAADPARGLRLLSLPCATGEEPYSMAMALLDAGIAPTRFRIDARDVSAATIARAGRACYGDDAFRGAPPASRDAHFDAVDGTWRASATLRGCVDFAPGNVFVAGPAALGTYDAVFCRNLLIYFGRAERTRAAIALARRLAPDGLLFVGPSETGLLPRRLFAPSGDPMAFAFRPRAARAARRVAPMLTRAGNLPSRQGAPAPQGADAYHRLGAQREAGGDRAGAVALYRKALYLEPGHADALRRLAALLARQGDTEGARQLQARLAGLSAGRANAT